MPSLPPKLYFRIGEVASLVGVEPHVLRYWEREFRSIRPTKSAKGQRVYSRRDVENLMRVRDLLYADGFTIAGAKKKLQRSGQEPAIAAPIAPITPTEHAGPPSEHAGLPATAPGHLSENERRGFPPRVRAALMELRTEMQALLAELDG
jgi:DNA-binding transcriptional MerR regulator